MTYIFWVLLAVGVAIAPFPDLKTCQSIKFKVKNSGVFIHACKYSWVKFWRKNFEKTCPDKSTLVFVLKGSIEGGRLIPYNKNRPYRCNEKW